ncbi:ABC transporter ATP-binding protein [Micrococcus sp.]|uniref:ABC transporter ATP-binding protein n=1 Tax=Micrococcus sp. TaxID=1271 RepID=UPI0026DD4848|nr:ATP-binding cassette domain-containing protein [Micrococcus sp.]MDO4239069.1 ATP-binding cassette domain-containing protein [Micrococcus sp.]
MTVLVDLRDVVVTEPRSGRRVLGPLSLRVHAGERILVMGPSGSGKSTLLDVVSGMASHAGALIVEGRVEVCGRDPRDCGPVELSREVGQVPQDPGAATCLGVVEDEVALTLENHGVDPGRMDALVDRALVRVGAAHLRRAATDRLSGGELQRVGTAASLAADPRLVLADEPTSMLDDDGAARTLDALLGTAPGAAVLLVEHRLRGAGDLPDRTLLLREGRVVADGPTADVLGAHGPELARDGCWVPGAEPERPWSARDAGAAPVGGPAVVRAQGIVLRRAGRLVLDGLDLEVRPGTLTALRGPNGAGKSTLLSVLLGTLRPDGGRVLTRPGDGPGLLVPQDPERQFLTWRVRDEVVHALPRALHAAALGLAGELGLDPVMDTAPHRLSGGEKRRLSVVLALAAALPGGRPLLVADEPTFGLDLHGARAVASLLHRHAQEGGAVVFATHDEHIAGWADRTLRLDEGRLREDAA